MSPQLHGPPTAGRLHSTSKIVWYTAAYHALVLLCPLPCTLVAYQHATPTGSSVSAGTPPGEDLLVGGILGQDRAANRGVDKRVIYCLIHKMLTVKTMNSGPPSVIGQNLRHIHQYNIITVVYYFCYFGIFFVALA